MQTCLLYSLVRICFYFKNGNHYPYLLKALKALNERKCEKDVLLHIHLNRRCLTINIEAVSITGRVGKTSYNFSQIPRF